MKRIFLATLLLQLFAFGCKADSSLYKEEIIELLQNPNTRKFKGGDKDLSDLSGCPLLVEIGNFDEDGRDQSWFDGRIYTGSGIALDRSYKLSTEVLPKNHPVYIGPWQKITLTKTEGNFFNSTEAKEERAIRFFAYQSSSGGPISYQYESQTEENKNIPEKPFSLSGSIAPDKFSLCVVKWTAKFGYNAIAEVKSKNRFSKNYLVPTGKIIELEE